MDDTILGKVAAVRVQSWDQSIGYDGATAIFREVPEISALPDLLESAIAIRDNDVPSDEQWKAFEAAIAKATQ